MIGKSKQRYVLLYFAVGFLTSFSVWAQDFVPGEVIVKLKGKSSQQRSFFSKSGNHGLSLKGSWSSINLYQYALKPGADVHKKLQELKNDPDVEYAEPNYIIRKALFSEGDNYILSEAEVEAIVSAQSYALTDAPIYAIESWTELTGSTKPIVAVIDTGVDVFHSALSDAIWVNSGEVAGNGIDDDGNGFVDDVNGWDFVNNTNAPYDCDGHGTHVAGIVRGGTQDLLASPMGANEIQIMPLRFLDCSGNGTTSDAINAIYYAVNNGAKVLNNSWGGGGFSQALLEAIVYSYQAKTVFIAAAGNAGSNNDYSPIYPAAYDVPNLIAVAASSDSDYLASFSNYGQSTVHVAAPGVNIFSTWPSNQYAILAGTSMAAPFVSSLAAMMAKESPTMNGYQIKEVLLGSSDTVSGLSGKVITSSRVNLLSSVQTVKSTTPNSYMPSYSMMSPPNGERQLASEIANNGATCGLVRSLLKSGNKGKGPPTGGALFVLLLVPLILIIGLRQNKDGKQRRKFDRFEIHSAVSMEVDGQKLKGSLNSISLGGVGLNADALLKEGSVVSMKIRSPDGSDEIEVQGNIVWSQDCKEYGLQFSKTNDSVMSTIQQWTKGLVKT